MNPLDPTELLDLPQLAERIGIPVSVARYYRDRFILFVPSVRIGRTILHPPEAIEVMRAIGQLAADGKDARAIETDLDVVYPVTVVNAQQIEPAGLPLGQGAALRAVASAFDARGARLEGEVAQIRDELAGIAARQEAPAGSDLGPALEAAVGELAGLGRVTSTIDGLHARLEQLASREQLEWIGDVVAAAALRPPQGAMDGAIERRLNELQGELQKSQGRDETDTPAALERLFEQLTSQMSRRDQEIHRAFQSLVAALRQEVTGVHAGIAELKRSVQAMPSETPSNGTFEHAGALYESTGAQLAGDHGDRSRAPRRLGQPLKPNGLIPSDDELAHGTA